MNLFSDNNLSLCSFNVVIKRLTEDLNKHQLLSLFCDFVKFVLVQPVPISHGTACQWPSTCVWGATRLLGATMSATNHIVHNDIGHIKTISATTENHIGHMETPYRPVATDHIGYTISAAKHITGRPNRVYYPPFARRAKGEVFVSLYHVCLFVRSTISQQPAGRFTPYFACGRSLGRDVSSPLLGAKRGKMTWGWSHSCIGQLPFLFLSAMPNVVQYVGHRPAHILV